VKSIYKLHIDEEMKKKFGFVGRFHVQ